MSFIRLGNVCDFKGGTQPPKNEWCSELRDGYVRMLQIRDFTQAKTKYIEYVKENNKLSKCNQDDILIGRYGASVGKILTGLKGAYNVAIVKTIPDKEKLDKKFLYHFLLNPRFQNFIKNIGGRAAQAGFNKEDISNYNFFLPSLPDQIKIVNLLDKAETLIEQRKQSISLLDEFLKSTFQEMFGKLKGQKVSLSKTCLLNPKKSEIGSFKKDIEVSFIPMAFVSENGEVDLSQIRKLEVVWNGFTYFKDDDVVFAKITPCMENGKGAIMRNLKNGIGFGTTEFHVLRPIVGISNPEWLYHLTMQESFRRKAERNMTGSAGQKRVPTNYFDKYKIVVPPIELQTKFADIVKKIAILKQQYTESLNEVENLYSSISQRAFSGELKVSDTLSIPAVSAAEAKSSKDYKKKLANRLTKDELLQFYFICLNIFGHQNKPEENTLGEVKMEKTCHLAEYLIPELQFNRIPIKEEYGPADFKRLYALHHYASENNIFFHDRFGKSPKYPTGENFMKYINEAINAFKPYKKKINILLDTLRPLNTRKIDILATTYAAWNNLIILKQPASLNDIAKEGRWHARKSDFTNEDFQEAVNFLIANKMEPIGNGKIVEFK
ncbi:MAG TPA: restriction endonuclease subunit S [Ferruginibacter sp.]|nr:restriction endonuclease subunit S [Ferruginibacter sp.]